MEIVPDLSICTVYRDSIPSLRNLLHTIPAATGPLDVEIIAVDNGSTDRMEASRELTALHPELILYENPYPEPCTTVRNRAAALARGRFLLFTDDDALFSPGSLERLIDFMDDNPLVGLCGPKLLDRGRGLLPSARHRPTFAGLVTASGLLGQGSLGRSLLARETIDLAEVTLSVAAGWLAGACLLVRRETMDEIGLFDEGFPFFYADTEYCLRAGRAGWHLFLVPTAEVVLADGGRLRRRLPPPPAAGPNDLPVGERRRALSLLLFRLWRYRLALNPPRQG